MCVSSFIKLINKNLVKVIWLQANYVTLFLTIKTFSFINYITRNDHYLTKISYINPILIIIPSAAEQTGDLTAIVLTIVIPGVLMWLLHWRSSNAQTENLDFNNGPSNTPTPNIYSHGPNNFPDEKSSNKSVHNSPNEAKYSEAPQNQQPNAIETPRLQQEIQHNASTNNEQILPEALPVENEVQNAFVDLTQEFTVIFSNNLGSIIMFSFGMLIAINYAAYNHHARVIRHENSAWVRRAAVTTYNHRTAHDTVVPNAPTIDISEGNNTVSLFTNNTPANEVLPAQSLETIEFFSHVAATRFGDESEQRIARATLNSLNFRISSMYSYEDIEAAVNNLRLVTDTTSENLLILEWVPASVVISSGILSNSNVISFIRTHKQGILLEKYKVAVNAFTEALYKQYKYRNASKFSSNILFYLENALTIFKDTQVNNEVQNSTKKLRAIQRYLQKKVNKLESRRFIATTLTLTILSAGVAALVHWFRK